MAAWTTLDNALEAVSENGGPLSQPARKAQDTSPA
jgi:hypothetical protein